MLNVALLLQIVYTMSSEETGRNSPVGEEVDKDGSGLTGNETEQKEIKDEETNTNNNAKEEKEENASENQEDGGIKIVLHFIHKFF